MARRRKLTLVILNYNSQFWLKKSLTTLKRYYLNKTAYQVTTIVVDNASQDESVAMVKDEFPWVKLIESDQNLGFSAGNNLALQQVESEYAMLLNNDVELTTDSNFDQLISFMDEQSQVGICTPQVKLPNGDLDWACHRGEPTIWASLTYFLKLDQLFPQSNFFGQYHHTYKNLSQPHLIDACSGAAMLVRTDYMNQVGLLDERFFMYGEDLDWCRRFRELGYQIAYYPQVSLIHHKYKSGIKTESDLTALQTRQHFYNAMLLYYDKHFSQNYPRIFRLLLRGFIFIKKGGM